MEFISGLDRILEEVLPVSDDGFVEIVVDHGHRAGAATGEALGELDAELPVLRHRDRVVVGPPERSISAISQSFSIVS